MSTNLVVIRAQEGQLVKSEARVSVAKPRVAPGIRGKWPDRTRAPGVGAGRSVSCWRRLSATGRSRPGPSRAAAPTTAAAACRGARAPSSTSAVGPLLDDLAAAHHQHVVADVADHREVVADEDQPDAGVPSDVVEQVEDLGLDRHVERRHGLVEHEHPRRDGEGPRDRDALALAAGQLVAGAPSASRSPRPTCVEELGVRAARAAERSRSVCSRSTSSRQSRDPDPRVEREIGVLEHDLDGAGPGQPGRAGPGRDRQRGARRPRSSPESGGSSPTSIRAVVVLPEPDSPTRPTEPPGLEPERQTVDGRAPRSGRRW